MAPPYTKHKGSGGEIEDGWHITDSTGNTIVACETEHTVNGVVDLLLGEHRDPPDYPVDAPLTQALTPATAKTTCELTAGQQLKVPLRKTITTRAYPVSVRLVFDDGLLFSVETWADEFIPEGGRTVAEWVKEHIEQDDVAEMREVLGVGDGPCQVVFRCNIRGWFTRAEEWDEEIEVDGMSIQRSDKFPAGFLDPEEPEKKLTHAEIVSRACDDINAVFGDMTVSKEQTQNSLEHLRDELTIKLDALKGP